MKTPTKLLPPSQGRIIRHGRFGARCCVGTLTTVAALWLASPVSPLLETPKPVPGQFVTGTSAPALPSVSPEPLRFAKLDTPAGRATPPARQAAPPARTAITIEPDTGAADFVPTPEPPAPTPETTVAAQHVAPPRIDDPTVADQPTRARDTVTDIQCQKLDTALRQALDTDPATPVRVILRTAPGASETTAEWLAAEGRQIHQLHPSFGGLTATLSASDVAVLTEDPSIRQMSIDAIVEPAKGKKGTPGAALKGSLGLTGKKGEAASGNRTWAGKGITVAVIDSGIEPSQDLPKSRIVSFRDFANGGTETDPYDDNGHGTHVAGLIGGNGQASKLEYRGAASEVSFVGLKVLDAEGAGYTSDVLAARGRSTDS